MKRLALFLVLTLGSTACAQAQHRSQILAQATQGAPPQVCAEVFQPVCGTTRTGMRMTYSNACFARAAAATNVTEGPCPTAK
jgi:hypothetical protein